MRENGIDAHKKCIEPKISVLFLNKSIKNQTVFDRMDQDITHVLLCERGMYCCVRGAGKSFCRKLCASTGSPDGEERMLKNQYEQEYETISYHTPDGKMRKMTVYRGEYYTLHFDQGKKRNSAACNLLAALLALAILIGAGMPNQDSSHTVWIVLPYLCLFLPVGYWLIGAVFFCMAPLRMERPAYEGSLLRILHSCRGILILTGGNVALDLVYLALYHGTIHVGRELCYLACLAVLFLWVVLYGRWYDRTYQGISIEKP